MEEMRSIGAPEMKVIGAPLNGSYSIPEGGIPESDLSEEVQEAIDAVSGKQDALVSGTNIKTINNESVLGSGNIAITGETYVIDNEPTAGSSNLVKSGGVAAEVVWDVTAKNDDATFASLSALLSDADLATLIPTSVRKGGMQIRFVQNSDNKYVQFRYMPSDAATVATFTNVANWQGVDETPTAWSQNLVTSGGVYKEFVNRLGKVYDKTKSYFTMELNAGICDIRGFWNNTNIKNETPGTCTIDWGDGTPVVSVVNDDSFKHNYVAAGIYEICISGLTGITNNLFLRSTFLYRDVKFGNTFVNTGTYYMLNDTSGINSVEFFSTTPLTWGTSNPINIMNNVSKIIVPNEALFKYLKDWYFNGITTNKDCLTKKIVPKDEVEYIYKDIVVTVGTGGDFTSINDAIQSLSTLYPTYKEGGIKAVIKILTGTTISEQIYVDGLDLSWISIEYEGYNPESLTYDNVAESIADGTIVFDTTTGYNSVAVNASSWAGVTHDTRGDVCLFRAENGGRLPIINCVFKLTTPNSSYPACGCLCNRGSEAVIKTLCGFIGFQDGVISNNESSITIREGITLNCSRWGCHARHNGEVSARSVIATGCATNTTLSAEYGAAVADRVADIDVREAYLGGNVAIRCNNVSRVCARAAHVLSGGVADGYLVEATYSGKINASGMTFSNITGNMFKVQNAGWIDAFAVTNKTYSVSALNAIDGNNGIIWG